MGSGSAPEELVKETKTPVVDLSAQNEVARKTTLGDFMDFKKGESEKANSVLDKAIRTGEVPFGTTLGNLNDRASRLREEVDMLTNMVDSQASEIKDELYPDTPSFWEMNDGEQNILRQRVKDAPLTVIATRYNKVIEGFEADYQERYKGKQYKDMSGTEEDEARRDNLALDKMRKLHGEMLNFKPQPASTKTS